MMRFVAWCDRRNFVSVRTTVLGVTVWMTWRVTIEAWQFAHMSQFDGVGTAAVIAAVAGPLAALQAFVFKFYMEAK